MTDEQSTTFSPDYNYAQLIKIATIASTSIAVLLVLIKLSIWFISSSTSVLASSMDSVLDVVASCISFFAVRIAIKPADEDHHFGHGKAEHLAALFQASFIAGSAFYLIFYAISDLHTGYELNQPNVAIVAMIICTFITAGLVLFQQHVVSKTNSTAIKADAAHYKMDVFVNLGVLIALISSKYGYTRADPVISIIIAFIMLYSVKKLAWNAVDFLMDKALSKDKLDLIRSIIMEEKEVLEFQDLRTRQCNNCPVIQANLYMESSLTLQQTHEIGNKIKKNLLKKMPDAYIFFHIAPKVEGNPSP